MRTRLVVLSVMCVMLLLSGAAPVLAGSGAQAQPAITVTATAGYGETGAYLIGEWVPVRVTLNNPAGGQSLRVTVSVSPGTNSQNGVIYEREVDLPSPSRKEITLYAYDGNYTRTFAVSVSDGERQIASVQAGGDPFEPPNNLIVGVVSSDSSLLNILKGEQVGHIVEPLPSSFGYYGGTSPSTAGNGTATVAHMALADIPPVSQALDNLGAIVLDDVDTGALAEEQRGALEGWVARGGTLIVTYRAGGADTLAGLDNLSPVSLSGSRNVSSLASISDFVGKDLAASGPFAVGNAAVKGGLSDTPRVLAVTEGTPLLVVRDLGQGQVVYLGSSLSLPPLKSWDGTADLVKKMLADHDLQVSYGAFTRANSNYNYTGIPGGSSVFETFGGLFALPGLELPNAWVVAAFLVFYIIIVGPVNFIVLRRMKRVELAWFTIPVLVAIFSVVAYSLALGSKGGDVVAIRANVIQTAEGTEYASLSQHFGLYSPARRTYQLDLNGDSLMTEISAYGYYNGNSSGSAPVLGGNGTTSVRKVNIDTWSIRAFLAQHTAKLSSPLEADLELGNNKIIGKVTNLTNGPLEDVALVRGSEVQYIGYMAPGETTNVSLGVTAGVFDNTSPVKFLPPPAGVNVPQYGGYFYGNSSDNNPAQRLYARKVELLSAALYPLVSGEAPTDLKVIMLAWGPTPSTEFSVPGYSTRSEEVNVWTSTAQVKQGSQARLDPGEVPFTMYAPGNNPSTLAMGKRWMDYSGNTMVSFFANSGGSIPPGQVLPIPTLAPVSGSMPLLPVDPENIQVSPYVDMRFRLPVGTKPDSLTLSYLLQHAGDGGTLDVMAYNAGGGGWDKLTTLDLAASVSKISISNPTRYVADSGEVIIRLLAPKPTILQGTFEMSLNSPD